MRMSNTSLETMEKSLLPLLTFIKPNLKKDETVDAPQGSDIEEVRSVLDNQLASQVRNMLNSSNMVDPDDKLFENTPKEEESEEPVSAAVDDHKAIKEFYEVISQKLMSYDPVDRDICYYDDSKEQWITTSIK